MSAPAGERGNSPISFCVASWNIHRCVGVDGGCEPSRVAAVLEELGCDPIGLQEVDNSGGPAPTSRQLDYLAGATRMRAIAGMRIIRHRGHYGNALLTRWPVIAERRHDLSIARREPRGVLDVELDVQGLPVRFLVTHLGLGPFERRYQMRRLLEIVTSAPAGEPIVLLGDINEWWPHGRLLRSLHLLFGRPPAVSTFPARLPFLALDRIWSRPRASLVALGAHRSALARIASDHLPVVATLSFAAHAGPRNDRILIAGG